jgi:hypothetical protein
MPTPASEDLQIPVNEEVSCTDGVCGRSTYVLINPVGEKVTHVVVKQSAPPHTEYMVPVNVVASATAKRIELRCTLAELEDMDPFVQTQYITEPSPTYSTDDGSRMYWPYATAETTAKVDTPQIPPGELAVQRGTRVEATDGHAGRVDEFLVNPATGNITHLVMREGHLWGQRDVTIPISAIRETRDGTVYLTLDKQQVEALPSIAVRRM